MERRPTRSTLHRVHPPLIRMSWLFYYMQRADAPLKRDMKSF